MVDVDAWFVRLARGLSAEGATFEIVGSASTGRDDAKDLDILIAGSAAAASALLQALRPLVARPETLPAPAVLVSASPWHFDTHLGPVDVFIGIG